MNFMIRENIIEAFKSIRSHALRAASNNGNSCYWNYGTW